MNDSKPSYLWGAFKWFFLFMFIGLGAWLFVIGADLWDALTIDARIEWARFTGGLFR
ncbi:MAG: hypothetical protein Q8Q28_03355 [Pseudomonadota bacterium]|nr:hypothetical protein [Pseudomonadota bacterium]